MDVSIGIDSKPRTRRGRRRFTDRLVTLAGEHNDGINNPTGMLLWFPVPWIYYFVRDITHLIQLLRSYHQCYHFVFVLVLYIKCCYLFYKGGHNYTCFMYMKSFVFVDHAKKGIKKPPLYWFNKKFHVIRLKINCFQIPV